MTGGSSIPPPRFSTGVKCAATHPETEVELLRNGPAKVSPGWGLRIQTQKWCSSTVSVVYYVTEGLFYQGLVQMRCEVCSLPHCGLAGSVFEDLLYFWER